MESFEFSLFIRNSGEELTEQYRALIPETPQEIAVKYNNIIAIDPV